MNPDISKKSNLDFRFKLIHRPVVQSQIVFRRQRWGRSRDVVLRILSSFLGREIDVAVV